MNRIKSMNILFDGDGNIRKKATVNNPPNSIKMVEEWESYEYKGQTRYRSERKKVPQHRVQKILFEVEDSKGNCRTMTKDEAKKAFSSRQVRRSLKTEHKKILKDHR